MAKLFNNKEVYFIHNNIVELTRVVELPALPGDRGATFVINSPIHGLVKLLEDGTIVNKNIADYDIFPYSEYNERIMNAKIELGHFIAYDEELFSTVISNYGMLIEEGTKTLEELVRDMKAGKIA